VDLRADRAFLRRGLHAAATVECRGLAAAGLFASLILLYPVVLLQSQTYLAFAGIGLWAVWSLVGGAIVRFVGLDLVGRPVALQDALAHAYRHWRAHFGAPILLVVYVAILGGIALGIAQVLRVPVAGWILLALLSPVVLLLGVSAVWLFVRFVLAEHAIAPGVALGSGGAFAALTRSLAWLRKAPGRMIAIRNAAMVRLLWHSLFRVVPSVAVLAAVWLLLPDVATDAIRKALWLERSVRVIPTDPVITFDSDSADVLILSLVALVGSWVASAPAAMLFGAHAALYLLHRRDIDGVALDVPPSDAEGAKSLEELGFALVKRLGDEPEVS
jgi:hypothetical protein